MPDTGTRNRAWNIAGITDAVKRCPIKKPSACLGLLEQLLLNKSEIGLIGLATMGQNLALNFCDQGLRVVGWNLEPEVTQAFVAANPLAAITGADTHAELVASLAAPRRILIMIQAGKPVDEVLSQILPLLDRGDILIDGGNAHFDDTRRRAALTHDSGIEFVGLGVSGGELGARFGPSLMFGGSETAWSQLRTPLESIAANSESGTCAVRIGPDGAGHFVKMVHNGIEYADMQLIAEVYDIMLRGRAMTNSQIAEVFGHWNEGPLQSYLIELTSSVLKKCNDQGSIVDQILDVAEQKGTGRWAVAAALDLGVAVPSIGAAVDARVISSQQTLRTAFAGTLSDSHQSPNPPSAQILHNALMAAKICAYAQGLELIRAGSLAYEWDISIADVARVWTGGCIIRARILRDIATAYDASPALENLVLADAFKMLLNDAIPMLRQIAAWAPNAGIPTPAISASLNWLDGIHSARLPQNLIQAQRDAFGAHSYRRIDDADTPVHTDWLK